MENVIQKRAYELLQYIQLILGDDNYESPNNIFISLDKNGWTEAKKFPLSELIQVLADNGKYYLNEGVPYTDIQDVFDNYPLADRTPYATVNINGIEYQFDITCTVLSEKFVNQTIANGSLPFSKLINVAQNSVLFRVSAGNGPIEVVDLTVLRDALNIPQLTSTPKVFKITLPAAGSLAGRILNPIELPNGWNLAVSNGVNLIITHNTEKEIAFINVYEYNNGVKRLNRPFYDAYNGYSEFGSDVTIEGLNPVALPISIFMEFK